VHLFGFTILTEVEAVYSNKLYYLKASVIQNISTRPKSTPSEPNPILLDVLRSLGPSARSELRRPLARTQGWNMLLLQFLEVQSGRCVVCQRKPESAQWVQAISPRWFCRPYHLGGSYSSYKIKTVQRLNNDNSGKCRDFCRCPPSESSEECTFHEQHERDRRSALDFTRSVKQHNCRSSESENSTRGLCVVEVT
jgi:hypothetical protein